MKVAVQERKCVASGQCVALSPAVFDQGEDDGLVMLLNDRPSEDDQDDVRDAAAACPALAIDIQED